MVDMCIIKHIFKKKYIYICPELCFKLAVNESEANTVSVNARHACLAVKPTLVVSWPASQRALFHRLLHIGVTVWVRKSLVNLLFDRKNEQIVVTSFL